MSDPKPTPKELFERMSPEAKGMMRDWAKMQEKKYGPDWKRILAEEIAAKTAPMLQALLGRLQGAKKP